MKYVVIPSRVIDWINLHKSEKSIVKNDSMVHSAAASFEMAKKCSKNFRTATRIPSSRASK